MYDLKSSSLKFFKTVSCLLNIYTVYISTYMCVICINYLHFKLYTVKLLYSSNSQSFFNLMTFLQLLI
jgi:hypothetical protein